LPYHLPWWPAFANIITGPNKLPLLCRA
jgi:hypothetical protein